MFYGYSLLLSKAAFSSPIKKHILIEPYKCSVKIKEILKSMQNYSMFLMNTIWQCCVASYHIKKPKTELQINSMYLQVLNADFFLWEDARSQRGI